MIKKYASVLLGVLLLAAIPVSALAYIDCRDTDRGCTLEQLVQLNSDAAGLGFATPERIAIMQELIVKLTAQIVQLQSRSSTNASSATCLDLNNSLIIGSTDATTNGEVSRLQKFLGEYLSAVQATTGNAGVPPDMFQPVTGYYGNKTAANVMQWQKAHGMDFVTLTSGVGPMTRANMACGQKVAQCSTYESKPVITSITPSSGPVGTTIEIKGCNFLGFESDKVLWFTNSGGEKGILNGILLNGTDDAATRASNTVMRVTLPRTLCQHMNWYSGRECSASLTLIPGAYTVYSQSYGGNSNAVNFTVTSQ